MQLMQPGLLTLSTSLGESGLVRIPAISGISIEADIVEGGSYFAV
jgi:hypothetical protein